METKVNKGESFIVNLEVGYEDHDPFNLTYKIENSLLNSAKGKVYLGERNNKECRFCNKNKFHTKFTKQAHIIPEFMGNKKYFSYFECDSCNELFSRYETSLSSYGGIINTFSRVKGKKGYSKHKGINEKTETVVEGDKIVIRINNPSDENHGESEKAVLYEKGNLTFNTNKYTYVPLDAYKALVKIGFSLLTTDYIHDYELTRNWLLDKGDLNPSTNNPLLNVYEKVGGGLFNHPWAVLMKKRLELSKCPTPTHTMLLFYGLFAFQVFLPGNVNDQWIWDGNGVILPISEFLTHSNLDKDKKVRLGVKRVDFSSKERIKNPKHSFSVGFKESN